MKSKIADDIYILICDDIRSEVGGKSSFMGVYNNVIIVPKLPAVLPRLSFAILVFKSKIIVSKMEAAIVHPQGRTQLTQPRFYSPVPAGNDLNINLFMAPFKIEVAGKRILEITFNEDDSLKISRAFDVNVDPKIAQALEK